MPRLLNTSIRAIKMQLHPRGTHRNTAGQNHPTLLQVLTGPTVHCLIHLPPWQNYGHQPQRSRGLSGASGDVHSENPPSAASDSHLNQRSKGRRSYANARGAKGASFSNARKQDDYITFGSRAAGKGASRSAPTYDFDGQEPPRRGIVSSIFRGCF
ncbi:uncharacterized protein EI90DRAFT_1015653 [Cantharellus anzutake]|uniref:uncharacterized protein n=1 Tax=Cantharellus anzutake TaxID=1750568 RepID=UPI0019072397|nr:uncharacterized protein EI90DRAFT_1015653 [Cantharellus anzutake]KAF8331380.1 hypothetical protein EI90DRAFT_1015653 [Cantharellus anzutake]